MERDDNENPNQLQDQNAASNPAAADLADDNEVDEGIAAPLSPVEEGTQLCGAGCGEECILEVGNSYCRHGVLFHSICLRALPLCCPHLSLSGQTEQELKSPQAPSTLDSLLLPAVVDIGSDSSPTGPGLAPPTPDSARALLISLVALATMASASTSSNNADDRALTGTALTFTNLSQQPGSHQEQQQDEASTAPPTPPTLLPTSNSATSSSTSDIDHELTTLAALIKAPRSRRIPCAAWRCTTCTYGNSSRHLLCEMCEEPRSSSSSTTPSNSQDEPIRDPAPAHHVASDCCVAPHGDACITCFNSFELVTQHPCGCRVVCQPCADMCYNIDSRCVCTACGKRQVVTAGSSNYAERRRPSERGDYQAARQQYRAEDVACVAAGCGAIIDPYHHVADTVCDTHVDLWVCGLPSHQSTPLECPVCRPPNPDPLSLPHYGPHPLVPAAVEPPHHSAGDCESPVVTTASAETTTS